jgi:trimeric autotransporter adhesin
MKHGLNKENSLPDPEFGRESSESARAIHYVVQKDTLMKYVSALFAQADPGNVSGSTIERKKMSTKTIYKRIALVAVAALGAGVLSVAPASATYGTIINETVPGNPAFATTGSTVGLVNTPSTQTQVSGVNNFVSFVTTATAGVLTITGSTLNTSATTGVSLAADRLSAVQSGGAAITYTVPTRTAGTITVNFFATVLGATSSTASDSLVITVIDAAQLLVSVANSTSFIGAGSAPVGVDAAVTASNLAGAAQAANIAVTVNNGVGTGAPLGTAVISATIDGPGLLGIGAANAAATGRFVAQAAAATAAISVRPDQTGVGGTSTIKIYSGTTLIATETVKFHGAVKTLVATPVLGSISDVAGVGDGRIGAVITALDAAGTSFKPAAADLSVAAADVTAAAITGVTFAAAGGADRTVSGVALKTTDILMSVAPTATKTGTKSITITHTDAVSAVKTTLAVPFTVGLDKATTAVLTTDKATYLPGEKITLTLTLKDAGGFAIADDATGTGLLAAGITANVSLVGDATTATAVPTVGGKKTWTLYAPLASGPITFAGKTGAGTTAPTTAVTLAATATVSESATMQALTTLINSLVAKINALSKLVTKIQKKVKA